MGEILWQANHDQINNSNLIDFIHFVENKNKLSLKNYNDLWLWSITDIDKFWECIWEYFSILDHGTITKTRSGEMPNTKWFSGSRLNYAEHIFRNGEDQKAIVISSFNENGLLSEVTREELHSQVASLQQWLKASGVKSGDTVCGFLPNTAEAVAACLATISMGAVWSSCSQDFGSDSVLERFIQIKPKVLFTATSYQYNGKRFDRIEEVKKIIAGLPIEIKIVEVKYLESDLRLPNSYDFMTISSQITEQLYFEPLAFDHPMYILFSSGTTGKPKAITHCHGGLLLEHLKYLSLHNEVKAREKFFWYSTTGWMMWNFTVAALLVDAQIYLFDGSPTFPDISALWQWAEDNDLNHFGTSAPFLTACKKNNLDLISKNITLQKLKTIGSTGAPLPDETFLYIYEKIKSDVWLCSMSGGTDVCTAFVGSNILSPVKKGFIQGRALGVDMVAMGENAKELVNEVGDMVIKQALPSMPIYFWNDPDFIKYKESYFEEYNIHWRHGDWLIIDEEGQLKITGRSDATLNRHGVRIGTAEIYNILDDITQISDSLIINVELKDGSNFMPLFIKMSPEVTLDDALAQIINQNLKSKGSPRHVPDKIIPVDDIPYTVSGKKMEAPIKKLFMGIDTTKAINMDVMRNPSCIPQFIALAKDFLFQN